MNFLELAAKLSLDSSDYESGLSKAKRLASSVSSGISKAFKIGAAAMTAATAATVAFGGAAVKTGMAFDKSMSQVAATMGKTMEEMENEVGAVDTSFGHFEGTLRDFAQYMGSNTAFSATQAADALNYMALAGYDAQTSMSMLPNVLNLAAAGSMELARASDMVTDTQTAFGITLERTSQMVDEMAKAASTGNTSVEQLGDAFLTVGGLAQELNGGFVTLADGTQAPVDGVQELEIALTAMANAGIKGSEAGTHMRNMLLKLTSPTDDGAAALENYGIKIFDANEKMRSMGDIVSDLSNVLGTLSQEEKMNVISDLFNTRDLASAEALMGAFGDKTGLLATKLREASYDGEALAAAYGNFTGKTYDADGAISELAGSLVRMQTWGRTNDEMLVALQNDFGLTAEEAQNAINTLGNVGDVKNSWDEIGASILDAEGAASQMAETQLDNLAGDITLLKSAFEGAQIAISDGLTPELRKFVQFGTKSLSRLTEAFKSGGLKGAMGELGSLLSEGTAMIVEKVPEFLEAGAELLSALGEGIIENLPMLTDAAVEVITMMATYLIDALPEIAQAGMDLLVMLGEGIVENLPMLVDAAVDVIKELCKILSDPVQLEKLVDAAVEIVFAIYDGVSESLPAIMEAAVSIITTIATKLTEPDNIVRLINATFDIMMAIQKGIWNAIPQILDAIGQMLLNILAAIGQKWNDLKKKGREIIEKIRDGIKQKIDDAKNWGRDLIQKFIDGLMEKWNALKQKVSNIAQSIKDFLGFSEPKLGPLSNFHTYAPDMMKLFAQGIYDNASVVTDAIADVFDFGDNFEYRGISESGYTTAGGDRLSNEIIAILRDIRENIGFDVVLDDGTLVGRIDRLLGRKTMQRARGGV